ncbi:MAG TPA: response regulator transcription factor [Miltoncostaeaceae bacterium]|nr:response regulator transcription factor [Miltoncostaeaceae bacterium]
MPPPPLRVLIADDHAAYREGLVRAVAAEPRLDLVGEAADGVQAIQLAGELRPDVLLLDARMPGQGGLDACRAILADAPHPGFRVVLITASPGDDFDARAREAGAAAGVGKETPRAELVRLLLGEEGA